MKNLRTILAIILTFFILSSITFSTEAALDLQEQISVTFSPQSDMNGYLFELVSVIDSAKNTLEIALYDLKDFDVFNALKHASARGVRIRMLSESAMPWEIFGFMTAQLRGHLEIILVLRSNPVLHQKHLIKELLTKVYQD